MSTHADYLRATRHPWPCLLFLLPLLALYEGGVYYLGGKQPEVLRNGADNWVRQGLAELGLQQQYWAPALLLGVLTVWNCWRGDDRPGDLVGVLCGMTVEAVLFALGLWGVSRGLGSLVDYLGLELSAPPVPEGVTQVVTFVGAGIYEELLFRLLLFSALLAASAWAGSPGWLAVGLSGAVSALLFSAAHHAGPHGEPFDGYTFLFRTVAGVYFAVVFYGRGFGVAVGAHACYDVIVGTVA
jgi:membrane protease YdiL (CAAX protease family)